MKRKVLSLFLALVLLLSLCGCGGTVGEIADNVKDAAIKELKNQVARVLEENKLEVVEIKTAFGQLNDDEGSYQLLLAALVKANSESVPQSAVATLGKVFTDSGSQAQSAAEFENAHLIHKEITFKQTDYSSGGYYVIWGYAADISIELPELTIPTKK